MAFWIVIVKFKDKVIKNQIFLTFLTALIVCKIVVKPSLKPGFINNF